MKKATIIENARKALGITGLNPMQQVMAASESNAVILLAPTGTGKTLAFALRLLRSLRPPGTGAVQAVVIAPSRELVMQIADVVRRLATGYRTVCLYGGHSMIDEQRSLQQIPDIIVATPGRLMDHINRRQVSLADTDALVLDEYDKALELGFSDEMRRIAARIRRRRLTILTSATALAQLPDYLNMGTPEIIDYTETSATGRPAVDVAKVVSHDRDKLPVLGRLLRSLAGGRVIVFVNHRESAERVYGFLRREGFPAGLYHGGLEQNDREKSIDMFNNGTTPVLVSTDLGSRGLDIDDVQAIVHYHMPVSQENWTHRNGRTARMGASGSVYVIVADGECCPEYVAFDSDFVPDDNAVSRFSADVATLYFNAGRREKLSRGDIAGFLINKGGLAAVEIGKIIVHDHYALAAVPSSSVEAVAERVRSEKIKGQRVRITPVK
ncbi:MAG: DEAD/DEAH box helicase [Muribaculaceae bacterium]|nr:DEAD/DEAH box helicase [Muribaculaceae bacterium]